MINGFGNVDSYNIYRGIDGVYNPTPIANVPYAGTGLNSYVDDVTTEIAGEGVFNYYIEAIEGAGNTFGFAEKSLSNIANAYQDPRIFIPNAFRPKGVGVNSIFKPVSTYIDIQEYEFLIFDRWGHKVF